MFIKVVKPTSKSQTYYKPHHNMDCAKNCKSNPKLMCPNLLLRRYKIPFTSMEPPFVLMVGKFLQNVDC
jgi:hypothetical protein